MATIVLIFVVYVSNLGKMMKIDSQVENIAGEGIAKKFRFVAQLQLVITRLHMTFRPKSRHY